MGKWTRRAFISAGVLTSGVVIFGVAVRPGNRADKVRDLIAKDDESVFNVWVKIAPDNTVTAILPHAEMGQGVHTTLAMMLAEELDADWDRLEVAEAPADKEYANYALGKGFVLGDADVPAFLIDTIDGVFLTIMQAMDMQITGGSSSVPMTGQQGMRVAGAATRAVLLEAAAKSWNVPVAELSASKSQVRHEKSARTAPYSEFAQQAAALSLPPKPRLKTPDEFTLLGTDVQRIDIPAKVNGSAMFGLDATPPGMKYATVKASPVFGTNVQSVNEASIQAMPGIRKVINLGDAVAVVADGYWQAKQALDRLEVKFEENGNETVEQSEIYHQFATDMDAATANNDEIADLEIGDARNALAGADTVIEAEYRVPYLAHAAMEPMNCTAWVHDDICEIWTGTQNPLGFAAEVANALEMDLENVHLNNAYLGGGFGRRAFPDYTIQAAKIAAEVAYPVKLIWSREEDMRHDHYRQASVSRFTAGLDGDGKTTAWINQYVDKYDPVEAPYPPYDIDNQYIHYAESGTHVPWGFWRSVDHSLHAFFTESFIDEVAIAAGEDPYQYRHNMLAGQPRIQKVLDLAAEKSNWDQPLPENWGRGIAVHKSFGTIVAQVVEVEVVAGK
ncbi:MAG: molybdopterin cofactor-binding domain-containing protein, partial [Woeseiales bacterium]